MTASGEISQSEAHYISIPLETVCDGSVADFDLFMRSRNEQFVLFISSGTPVDGKRRDRLLKQGRRVLHVRCEDEAAYHRYVADHLDSMIDDPRTPADRKAEIVYEAASNTMVDVLAHPGEEENIERATSVVRNTVSVVSSADRIDTILGMTSFDYTTHTHSVNVCVYGLALARHMGMHDSGSMRDLGMGLLLHDVGKAKVDPAVLNKPGRLTPDEFGQMKKHPEYGEDLLRSQEQIPELAIQIVGQHHERADGTGYPRALGADTIQPFARLAGVIDVFDALTTRRPYKEPMPTFDALRLMKNDEGHYDDDVLGAFIKMLMAGSRIEA